MLKKRGPTARTRKKIEVLARGQRLADGLAKYLDSPVPKSWSFDSAANSNAVARIALNVNLGTLHDASLRLAFEAYRLDPVNPADWRLLAGFMAAELFPVVGPGGRHIEWDTDRYLELWSVALRKARENPELLNNATAICRLIAQDKTSPAHFHKAGVEGLRRRLRYARSVVAALVGKSESPKAVPDD